MTKDSSEVRLSKEELIRYNRQIIYQDWGEEGQRKIKQATVFIAGVGGLGGPVSMYLAAAGVGKLKICDNGYVEPSNLNRQILFNNSNLNQEKASVAKNTLNRLNPHIAIEHFSERISRDNIDRLVRGSEIIVDCLDNFETRYILNEYAVSKRLPFVHAGVEGLAGQVTFIHPPETPCLKCIVPRTPVSQKVFPIIGTTAGILGCLEANEVLKYLTGIGFNLKGVLIIWNGMETDFHRIEIGKDPDCPVCGKEKYK